MDLPQPPPEQELKNIIDKLAQFVARNGPEFEQMTKQKQKDNPKFSFLFGGEYFNYYQYRVTTEQAIIKQKQRTVEQQQAIVQHVVNQQSIQSAPWQQQPPQQPLPEIHEQIRQSEQNLAAQHQLLLQQQQVQVDEAVRKAQDEKIAKLAIDSNLTIEQLDGVLQPIIDNCTKDSISTGKGWIFAHATSSPACDFTVHYILKKVAAPGIEFETKLHLVYLVNDVLHHCSRKNVDELKKTLDKLVVPIFCSTSIGASPEQQQKLHKLYKLWETNKYFSQQVLDQLQNPVSSLASYQANLISEYGSIITPITTSIQAQYTMLQKQHKEFAAHLTNSIHHMQQLPYAFQSSQNPLMAIHPSVAAPFSLSQPPPPPPPPQQPLPQRILQGQPPQQPPMQQPMIPQAQPPVSMDQLPSSQQVITSVALTEAPPPPPQIPLSQQLEDGNSSFLQNQLSSSEQQPTSTSNNAPLSSQIPGPGSQAPEYNPPDIPPPNQRYLGDSSFPPRPNGQSVPSRFGDEFSPGYIPPSVGYMEPPEFGVTQPPPPHIGSFVPSPFGPPRGLPLPINQHDIPPHRDLPPHHVPPPPRLPPPHEFMDPLMPNIPPYYDLPAGLMVPLVKLDDTDYNQTLDPIDIKLPAPALPSERLIAAVELFYSPPSHDRARNSEGWEQLGLYEYFKAKAQAKKQIEGFPDNMGDEENICHEPTNMLITGEPIAPVSITEKVAPRRRYREFKSPDKAPDMNDPTTIEFQTKANTSLLGDRSSRRSRSKSRSRSPPIRHRSPVHRYNRRSPRSRSPSPSDRDRDRERDRDRGKDRNRSRKRSLERSPTPPSFFGGAYATNPLDRRLDESNKGHQLLKKMGWSGAGLGATEQGIQDPVDAGDVRDRQDMYKGIGISLNDPYENFRKSKGQAFINRMKARAEELGKM